jgi:hypothetical protein
MPEQTRKDVFTVIERPNREKAIWVRLGSAFINRDSSLNVFLDALPVNGKLQIRDPLPRDERRSPNPGRTPIGTDTGRADHDPLPF